MTPKKKELEIVYNLEWKNKPTTNGDEKSNMVGILDIPATTLDWKTFKSYLLKNSGAADDNVKVSYIDSDDREKAINSQLDFEIALYTFRQKARMNEIITLKLDCVGAKKSSGVAAVKTMVKDPWLEPRRLRPVVKKPEKPPEWFLEYMKKFKEDLLEEISTICSSKTHPMSIHHSRKLKADRQRTRKATPLLFGDVINDKEFSKSAKMERKLESKLEKLEHKTMKIKAKKMALRGSSDSDVGRSSSKNDTANDAPSEGKYDVSSCKKGVTPHMIGGESYYQTWEITNTGTLRWTEETVLRYAWGSQALKPLSKEVPCPALLPGETGTISVLLEIPKTPGTYECYWHFYHEGRRFGNWLGCELIVDEPPVKNVPYVPSPTYDVININESYELVLPTSMTMPMRGEARPKYTSLFVEVFPSFASGDGKNETAVEAVEEAKDDGFCEVEDITNAKEDPKIDTNPFSDTDNQSIVSISDSSVHSVTSEDFVMLKANAGGETSPPAKEADGSDVATGGTDLAQMNVSSVDENLDNDGVFRFAVADEENADECAFLKTLNLERIERCRYPYHIPQTVVHCKAEEDEVGAEERKENEEDHSKASVVKNEKDVEQSATASAIIQQTPIDLSNKSVASEEANEENNVGYAYVQYKGRKIPISKKYLSPEFLATAESVPDCELNNLGKIKLEIDEEESRFVKQEELVEPAFRTSTPPSVDGNAEPVRNFQLGETTRGATHGANPFCSLSVNNGDEMAGCPMSSSLDNDNRFFVFPQHYPGYEVVPPMSSSYVAGNGGNMPFQPAYGYNTLGEVLVNDWTTGLNYSACVRYPNNLGNHQYYNAMGNSSTANTSRGCSSIPNSSSSTPSNQSPESPINRCQSKMESSVVNICNGHCMFDSQSSVNNMTTDCAHNVPPESVHSASNQTKTPSEDLRGGSTRVPDLLSGATVVATSAINTARSVLNMFVPPKSAECGRWQNGHWISTNPESKREKNLRLLYEMGFYNRDLNATLLARYNDDVNSVVAELLQ